MLQFSHPLLSNFKHFLITICIVTFSIFSSVFSQDSTKVSDKTQNDSLKTEIEEEKLLHKLFIKDQYIRGEPFVDSVTGELVIPFDSVGSSPSDDSIPRTYKKGTRFHTLSKANLVEIMNQKESYFIPGQLFGKFTLNSPGVYNTNEKLFFENKISAFFTMSAQPIWGINLDNKHFLKPIFRFLVEPFVLSLEIPLTVRMYHAKSKPVWNPSYEIIPKIHWAPKNVNKPIFSNMILSWGPMVHHSNGQEKLLWDPAGTITYNEHFGSFSTWYNLLGLQLYYQWSDNIIGLSVWWEHYYDNHFEFPLQELNYGKEKLQIDLRFIWTSKTWKIWKRIFAYSHDPEWKFNLIVRHENLDEKKHPTLKDGDIPASVKDKGENYRRNIYPIRFSAVFRPGFLEYWGIYFEYYRGSDYYNTSFIRNIHYFRWGISFDKSPYYKKYK